jgi:hypothetical protein
MDSLNYNMTHQHRKQYLTTTTLTSSYNSLHSLWQPQHQPSTTNSWYNIQRVSSRFARVMGRPAGSTRFHRANSQVGFYLHPDRSRSQVGRVPGRPAGPVRVLKLWFLYMSSGLQNACGTAIWLLYNCHFAVKKTKHGRDN